MSIFNFFQRKKKSHKLFVSIGAGINQIPLIKEAQAKGFRVIGVDANSMAPGMKFCELKIQESVYDYKAVYNALREALFDGNIVGIMTRSFGKATQTTAYLCEQFNIPFLPFEASLHFTNKMQTKAKFAKAGIKVPDVIKIPRKAKNQTDNLPAIKKPIDGHGKQGVKFIETQAELKKEISLDSGKKNFIFEQYIEGNEIIAIGLIHKGVYILTELTDKEVMPEHRFIDIMHTAPSKYLHLKEKIVEIGQAAAEALEVKNAPFVMELIADEDETLWLIEAVPEFGGEFLADIAIPKIAGVNIIGEAINSQTGLPFKPPVLKENSKAFAIRYIVTDNGILRSFNKDALSKVKGVAYFQMLKDIGSSVKKPISNSDRVGVVITKGKTAEDAAEAARLAEEALGIQIR